MLRCRKSRFYILCCYFVTFVTVLSNQKDLSDSFLSTDTCNLSWTSLRDPDVCWPHMRNYWWFNYSCLGTSFHIILNTLQKCWLLWHSEAFSDYSYTLDKQNSLMMINSSYKTFPRDFHSFFPELQTIIVSAITPYMVITCTCMWHTKKDIVTEIMNCSNGRKLYIMKDLMVFAHHMLQCNVFIFNMVELLFIIRCMKNVLLCFIICKLLHVLLQ